MDRSPSGTSDIAAAVARMRGFNRFYTRRIGVLRRGLLDSPFPLAHARVVYELAHRTDATATDLRRDLDLDAGYLSRILRDLDGQGLLEKRRSAADGRRTLLRLSSRGRDAFADLDARSRDLMEALLEDLTAPQRRRLMAAMDTIESLLGDDE